jgi:hypothetical protein
MLTRESLGLIFDELEYADRIVAVFTGLVPSHPIGFISVGWFKGNLNFLVDLGCRDKRVCEWAAEAGSLECLKYAHDHGCSWDIWTCTYAAYYGSLECLKYAHDPPTGDGCCWDKWVCVHAASGGSLECLKYAHENGCPWDEGTCGNAAYHGSLECLKYAHEHGGPWNEATYHNAKPVCLEYLISNGCPH